MKSIRIPLGTHEFALEYDEETDHWYARSPECDSKWPDFEEALKALRADWTLFQTQYKQAATSIRMLPETKEAFLKVAKEQK